MMEYRTAPVPVADLAAHLTTEAAAGWTLVHCLPATFAPLGYLSGSAELRSVLVVWSRPALPVAVLAPAPVAARRKAVAK